MQQMIAHLMWLDLNQNEPVQTWISEACFVIQPNVPMIDMLFLCCFSACCVENVYIFFLFRQQFTCHQIIKHWNHFGCHVHYKGPMALINFKSSLVIFFSMCINIIHVQFSFCWFKECIRPFNVTTTLVIIKMLSSCSRINIRLIFVCNTL